MTRKQWIAMVGAAAAFVTLALLWHVRALFAGGGPALDDPASRMAFVLSWLVLPGLSLLIGIIGAARRGFYGDAIDGTRTPANHALEINLRYNQNTMEQVMLAALAWGALSVKLPHEQLFLIPAMAVVFFVGRITFFIGYLINPVGRAYGMTLTALPTLVAYGWLLRQMLN